MAKAPFPSSIAAIGIALQLGCAAPNQTLGGSSSDEATGGSSDTTTGGSSTGTPPIGESVSTDATSEGTSSPADSTGDTVDPVEPPRVLFIGNSYTFVNDLPGMFESMTAAAQAPWVVASIANAGATVADHVVNAQLPSVLAEGWDVVVVQGQSVEPVVAYGAFEQGVVELAALIEADSGGADLVLFETWARQDGSPELAKLGMTAAQMQQALTDGYAAAAAVTGGIVAPVGQSWANALVEAPELALYAADGSHPSLAGSFLATSVFFAVLTGTRASDSAWVPEGLLPEDADRLEAVADATVGR